MRGRISVYLIIIFENLTGIDKGVTLIKQEDRIIHLRLLEMFADITLRLTWGGRFNIGCGDDPIGFLIASHAAIRSRKPNRFEVIDETGRNYVRYGVSIELSYQDDGKTLKVFIKPEK